jgi:hypothetical protein
MKISLDLKTPLLVVAVILAGVSCSFAQATRTWVSGVGDDANPGSRTAPCKTFAGAISKTAAGGEISVLDPGGFGALTITKSMTLNGDGTLAAILASGTNGIIINAGVTDIITIRNLSIKNSGGGVVAPSGLFGIKIIQAGEVHIENCTIVDGTDIAVAFQPTNSGAKLFVKNSTFVNCQGSAIRLTPGSSATANISNSESQGCKIGLRADAGSKVTAVNCVFSGSSDTGVLVRGAAEVNLVNCSVANNLINGINSGFGLTSAIVRMSQCSVVNNVGSGLINTSGSQIISFGNNTVSGNSPDGSPTSTVTLK